MNTSKTHRDSATGYKVQTVDANYTNPQNMVDLLHVISLKKQLLEMHQYSTSLHWDIYVCIKLSELSPDKLAHTNTTTKKPDFRQKPEMFHS